MMEWKSVGMMTFPYEIYGKSKKIMYKHVPKHQPNVSIEWHISHVYRRGFQDSISGTHPKCDYWVDVHSWTNRLDTNVSGLQNTIWLFFIPWVGWHFKTIRRILLSKIQYLWIYLAQFKQYIQIYKGWYMSKSRLYSSAFWCIFSKDLPPYSSSAIYGSPSWGCYMFDSSTTKIKNVFSLKLNKYNI